MANKSANIINHFGLVLDASSSMQGKEDTLVKVADGQIQYWAQRSKELNQETRVSVWVFSGRNTVQCVIWDMDVLRLPSIVKFYRTGGNTALVDATLQAISDLRETPERYGNHSFLLYALTDGEENDSNAFTSTIQSTITSLPDHWTVAALVPNVRGVHEAKRFGFPAGNIEVWDTSSNQGVTEVGERIRAATDSYMVSRSQGMRSTRTLFSTAASVVNADTIKLAGLTPLARSKYHLVPVVEDGIAIKQFVEDCGWHFIIGNGYYELMKTESIQPQKEIAIVEKSKAAKVYVGDAARQMLGLPDMEVRVKPDYNPDYLVYVQSTSVNRKLKIGTKFLYLK